MDFFLFSHSLIVFFLHHISQGKTNIVAAEKIYPDGAAALAEMLTKQIGIDCRACVLGHLQRGGMASCADRTLATKLGAFAVDSLVSGAKNVMSGEVNNKLVLTKLADTGLGKKKIDPYLLDLYKTKLSI